MAVHQVWRPELGQALPQPPIRPYGWTADSILNVAPAKGRPISVVARVARDLLSGEAQTAVWRRSSALPQRSRRKP